MIASPLILELGLAQEDTMMTLSHVETWPCSEEITAINTSKPWLYPCAVIKNFTFSSLVNQVELSSKHQSELRGEFGRRA